MSDPIDNAIDEMYDLVGHISFGDIADLKTYWKSLADALKAIADKLGLQIKAGTPVSGFLLAIKEKTGLDFGDLVSDAQEMEELSDKGSSDSIGEEEAEKLREKAAAFEIAFETLFDGQLREQVFPDE